MDQCKTKKKSFEFDSQMLLTKPRLALKAAILAFNGISFVSSKAPYTEKKKKNVEIH